ncbi:MAG TPA: lipopolysaccharide heptosyltransferase family protein, partial [Vulgatibacter sp.]
MRLLRWLGRALVIALARVVFGKPRSLPPGEVRKVLVIRTDERVGNVLLTIPLLRALRQGLPNARIVFLHAASKAALVKGLPYADRFEPFEKKRFFRHPVAFFSRLWRLRRERFDVAIEAGHYHAFSLTAALLARAMGARQVVGHDRGPARHFFDHAVALP